MMRQALQWALYPRRGWLRELNSTVADAPLQPGNREWVTAIEAICADGYSLPPCVIFEGRVAIASWFENLPPD